MTNENFRQIVEQYERLVFTICFQFVRDYQEAQNLSQETFISAFRHIDSCLEKNYKPWISRIAVNKCKDYLKSAYKRKIQLSLDDDNSVNVVSIDELSPDKVYFTKEKTELIKNKIYSLKEPYLKASIMFFIEDRTIEEISKDLCRPPKTVRTQIYRARGILQKELEKED